MKEEINKLISNANDVLIIQAENPDGDSLGTALALEQILHEMGKQPLLYCPVQTPRYLRYMDGWSRVSEDFPNTFDLTIIVDTSSRSLMERVFEPSQLAALKKHPVIVLDHHSSENDLPLEVTLLNDTDSVSTGELVYVLAQEFDWPLNTLAKENIAFSIMSDSLGLTSDATTARSIRIIADIVEAGVSLSELDNRRRELSKKSEEIFRYKGQLFERAEFYLDNKLGLIVIPWEDIQEYSDSYNPSMLILDELRSVEKVCLTAAFKLYPDGKITCKLRANTGTAIANIVAEHFGGGGHPFAAGFKVRDIEFSALKTEFLNVVNEKLGEIDEAV